MLLLCSRAGIVPPVAFKSWTLKGSEDTGLCTREAETTKVLGRRNWKQREQQLLVAKRRAGEGVRLRAWTCSPVSRLGCGRAV